MASIILIGQNEPSFLHQSPATANNYRAHEHARSDSPDLTPQRGTGILDVGKQSH
jgi:hypothetical protein